MIVQNHLIPKLGFGLSLRSEHYQSILENPPKLDFLEIIAENFMTSGGNSHKILEFIQSRYPLVIHGVSLSIGSTEPLNWTYLTELKKLIERVQPVWISDHFCWSSALGLHLHDLLPLPYTEETISHVSLRLKEVQDFLGRPILLENVSSYVDFQHSTLTEWECLKAIVEETQAGILLDINNIYVSAFNHGFDPFEYLNAIPKKSVQQFHLAGHSQKEGYIIDTHDADIISEVWELYQYAVERFGQIPTIIERDGNVPPLAELLREVDKARNLATQK